MGPAETPSTIGVKPPAYLRACPALAILNCIHYRGVILFASHVIVPL